MQSVVKDILSSIVHSKLLDQIQNDIYQSRHPKSCRIETRTYLRMWVLSAMYFRCQKPYAGLICIFFGP